MTALLKSAELDFNVDSCGEVSARKGVDNWNWFHVPDDELDSLLADQPERLARIKLAVEASAYNTAEVRTYYFKDNIHQCIEFNALEEDKDFYARLQALAARLGATLDQMDEYDDFERTSYDNGVTWVNGPHYGKKRLQWDLQLPMPTGCTLADIRAAHAFLLFESVGLFWEAGVSVL